MARYAGGRGRKTPADSVRGGTGIGSAVSPSAAGTVARQSLRSTVHLSGVAGIPHSRSAVERWATVGSGGRRGPNVRGLRLAASTPGASSWDQAVRHPTLCTNDPHRVARQHPDLHRGRPLRPRQRGHPPLDQGGLSDRRRRPRPAQRRVRTVLHLAAAPPGVASEWRHCRTAAVLPADDVPCRSRQGPVPHQALQHGSRHPPAPHRPGTQPHQSAQGLPPAHDHRQPRSRRQAVASPGLRRPGMAEDLLPAPQQRRGLQRLRQEPLAEGIESAGSRRIRGIAAQTILLAFQLAHANRRKIRKWLHTLSLGGERPRRRTHHRRPKKEPRSWTRPATWRQRPRSIRLRHHSTTKTGPHP